VIASRSAEAVVGDAPDDGLVDAIERYVLGV
jgi:hypothetical protein